MWDTGSCAPAAAAGVSARCALQQQQQRQRGGCAGPPHGHLPLSFLLPFKRQTHCHSVDTVGLPLMHRDSFLFCFKQKISFVRAGFYSFFQFLPILTGLFCFQSRRQCSSPDPRQAGLMLAISLEMVRHLQAKHWPCNVKA